ncbi:MAG: hypothetical protein AABZ64_00650 [Nitrospinota bacterium]
MFAAPIAQPRPLFLALVSRLFLQAHESVNRRVVFGVVAIAGGMGF